MRKAAVTQGHAFVGARPSLRHFAFFLDTPWIEKAIEAPWPAPFLLLSPFPWPSHRAPHVLTHIPGKARAAVACPFGVGAQGPGLGTPRGATDLQTFYNPPRSVPSPCILPPPTHCPCLCVRTRRVRRAPPPLQGVGGQRRVVWRKASESRVQNISWGGRVVSRCPWHPLMWSLPSPPSRFASTHLQTHVSCSLCEGQEARQGRGGPRVFAGRGEAKARRSVSVARLLKPISPSPSSLPPPPTTTRAGHHTTHAATCSRAQPGPPPSLSPLTLSLSSQQDTQRTAHTRKNPPPPWLVSS